MKNQASRLNRWRILITVIEGNTACPRKIAHNDFDAPRILLSEAITNLVLTELALIKRTNGMRYVLTVSSQNSRMDASFRSWIACDLAVPFILMSRDTRTTSPGVYSSRQWAGAPSRPARPASCDALLMGQRSRLAGCLEPGGAIC